jgi:hypothetical protein
MNPPEKRSALRKLTRLYHLQGHLKEGLRRAREIFGSDIPGLTDTEIEDSLWYYYFDVSKTVNYILSVPALGLDDLVVFR